MFNGSFNKAIVVGLTEAERTEHTKYSEMEKESTVAEIPQAQPVLSCIDLSNPNIDHNVNLLKQVKHCNKFILLSLPMFSRFVFTTKKTLINFFPIFLLFMANNKSLAPILGFSTLSIME